MLTKPFKPLALAFLVNLIISVEDKIKYILLCSVVLFCVVSCRAVSCCVELCCAVLYMCCVVS